MLSADNTKILKRASREVNNEMVINLGIGLPQLVPNFIPEENRPYIHSENGILGVGNILTYDKSNPDCMDAGGSYVSVIPGGSFVDSAESFGFVRRGKVDVSFLGAFQVSSTGDLANWHVPGGRKPGMGGGLEIASCAKKIIILMKQTDKKGIAKILPKCTFPLTTRNCVNMIITEKAVFNISENGLELIEVASGLTMAEIEKTTGDTFSIANDYKEF
jgi:acetate CoA/acetoacetate CoA-transferase beta subunit|tara:strand:+ start:301 stop:954 length:654 start_codon:yes stop_codon:yes gene_type:complete